MRVYCFGCKKFASDRACELRQHKDSLIRLWFHKDFEQRGCMSRLKPADWKPVDRALGETTQEELHKMYGTRH